ncbi:helix-turn-helix transcriptional regulator [Urbifossiella limnaea]|uniref:Helix-turn-helix domain-containing protein n=1 Tax=Urbifossiella limnaea TaxID=2528023 RepID=A0A517XR47_9BACT|nr:helix-turn-helix domain-containing protein [Urbifossiella limnaea]QDU19988.1 hypothetical protein ETAA1_19310 [Urbifossiella limnaea]
MPTHDPVPPVLDALADASLDLPDVAKLIKVSDRTARRLDAERAVPGRFTIGRLVRYHRELVLEWIVAGCPVPDAGKGVTRG